MPKYKAKNLGVLIICVLAKSYKLATRLLLTPTSCLVANTIKYAYYFKNNKLYLSISTYTTIAYLLLTSY